MLVRPFVLAAVALVSMPTSAVAYPGQPDRLGCTVDPVTRTYSCPPSRAEELLRRADIAAEKRRTREDVRKLHEPQRPTRTKRVDPAREAYGAARLKLLTQGVDDHRAPDRVQVMRVVDGDTLEVRMTGKTQETIRLLGVNAPDILAKGEQPLCKATESALVLKRFIARRGVDVHLPGGQVRRDTSGRLLAYVTIDDVDLGALQISRGYAEADPTYNHPKKLDYRTLQIRAADAQKGMWSDACIARIGAH